MDDEVNLEYDDEGIDWFYVEEDLALADELAETQIAEPGYAGTNYEICLESHEWDLYEFWDDLEFGLDTYWDGVATSAIPPRKKRKSGGTTVGHRTDKRLKLSPADKTEGSVVYVSLVERRRIASSRPPMAEDKSTWALLPDWKERFIGKDDAAAVSSVMPWEMRWAAEADMPEDEEGPDDSDMFHEIDGDSNAGNGEMCPDDPAEIDPELLKTVLRERLGNAGLNGLNEETFMQAIANMVMSGKDDADSAVGDLASSLLEGTTEGENNALLDWLTREGVSLCTQAEDGEAEEITENIGLETKTSRVGQPRSPPDGEVGASQPCGSQDRMSARSPSTPRAAFVAAAPPGGAENMCAVETPATGSSRRYLRKRKASGALFETVDGGDSSPPQRRVQRRVASSPPPRNL